ncbi:EAL domain-containing protein [Desulfosediminicola flagellatus]|uniref:bifunctional diguanylate cyclase/phosphodiesterase n=1 Tax=Desulfosediminicola flagellatus TaxID=2569541 RepID=UPI0010AC6FDD|nr:EAL domain-containing protein [Desulfosediminicola flagellatus]
MTLYRQLLFFTLILFFVLFIGIWVEKLQSTRSFLIDQLESHAQDTATSLGLSLSPVIAANDLPTAETMMNAVYDRGYYRIISLRDVEGKVITERVQDVQIAGVPSVFVQLVPIRAPSAESLIMAGWAHAGTLFVESHPGFAYRTLWETVVKVSIYFLITGSLVLIFGGLGLRMLLRPLKRVELQAEAICRKEYKVQKYLPRTRELRRVVDSMNRMTTRVRDMFDEQAQIAERLRRNAYSDQLTGLGNRRYLNGQVEAGLDVSQGTVNGAFMIVQLHDLQKINEEKGFGTGDEILKKAAGIIRSETTLINNVALARVTGGDFAVFMPEVSPDDVHEIAESLSNKLTRLAVEDVGVSDNVAHIGGVTYDLSPTLAQLYAEADTALRAAYQQGPNKWVVTELTETSAAQVKGKNWWKETLGNILDKKDIILFGQTVVACSDRTKIIHKELLSRITLAPGEIVSAGVFVPLAERMRMVSRLDRIVLEKALQLHSDQVGTDSIAVNVSASSLNDPEFQTWILSELATKSDSSIQFVFEFAEFTAVQYMDVLKGFSREVQRLGHAVGLDHFGQSFTNFGYLRSLRPEYVKIDRAFTNELIHEQSDSHFFIGSLCGVAHSLGVKVVAEGVEQEAQLELLKELNIDAIQGYLIDEPKPL